MKVLYDIKAWVILLGLLVLIFPPKIGYQGAYFSECDVASAPKPEQKCIPDDAWGFAGFYPWGHKLTADTPEKL